MQFHWNILDHIVEISCYSRERPDSGCLGVECERLVVPVASASNKMSEMLGQALEGLQGQAQLTYDYDCIIQYIY